MNLSYSLAASFMAKRKFGGMYELEKKQQVISSMTFKRELSRVA